MHQNPILDLPSGVNDLLIEVKEDHYWPKSRYDSKHFPEFHPCHQSQCKYGGVSVSLAAIVKKMVAEQMTEFKTTVFCKGTLSSTQGRKTYGTCHRLFSIKVKFILKEG